MLTQKVTTVKMVEQESVEYVPLNVDAARDIIRRGAGGSGYGALLYSGPDLLLQAALGGSTISGATGFRMKARINAAIKGLQALRDALED